MTGQPKTAQQRHRSLTAKDSQDHTRATKVGRATERPLSKGNLALNGHEPNGDPPSLMLWGE